MWSSYSAKGTRTTDGNRRVAVHGELRFQVAGSWTVALVFSLAGMYVGQIVRQRAAEQVFRRAFFIGLLALGTYKCLRGLGGGR